MSGAFDGDFSDTKVIFLIREEVAKGGTERRSELEQSSKEALLTVDWAATTNLTTAALVSAQCPSPGRRVTTAEVLLRARGKVYRRHRRTSESESAR